MKRDVKLTVRLSELEHQLLKEKMAKVGVTNQEAYIRKMILDGIFVRLDIPELKDLISLLRYTSNNINQIAKVSNSTGNIYKEDLDDIKANQEKLWTMANNIMMKLSKL